MTSSEQSLNRKKKVVDLRTKQKEEWYLIPTSCAIINYDIRIFIQNICTNYTRLSLICENREDWISVNKTYLEKEFYMFK